LGEIKNVMSHISTKDNPTKTSLREGQPVDYEVGTETQIR